VALGTGERAERARGGACRLDGVDVGDQTAAAERVLARQHARVVVLRRAQRTREQVQGTCLRIVQLVETGVHHLNDR